MAQNFNRQEKEESARENIRLNLAYYLEERGIKQTDLARSLGVNRSTVANWLRGDNSPDVERLAAMCEMFGISLGRMFAAPQQRDEPMPEEREAQDRARRCDRLFAKISPEFQEYILRKLEALAAIDSDADV